MHVSALLRLPISSRWVREGKFPDGMFVECAWECRSTSCARDREAAGAGVAKDAGHRKTRVAAYTGNYPGSRYRVLSALARVLLHCKPVEE